MARFRSFLLGVLITVVVLVVVGLVFTWAGLLDFRADQAPGPIETFFATHAVDSSISRHAPHIMSPLPATDANLLDGMKFYTMNCAGCHGGVNKKESAFGRSFYPPAPQLILNPLDDPEWRTFYAVKHGVRWTGMPAWEKTVGDDDLWKVTMFLTRVQKLPPAVQKAISQ